jgi:hypothetical protein
VAEPWWSSWSPSVAPYAVLLRMLVDGHMEPEDFEVVFLRLYKADPTAWPADMFDVLDRFFGDVDAFCPDPALRAEVHGIDADELRRSAKRTLGRLGGGVA